MKRRLLFLPLIITGSLAASGSAQGAVTIGSNLGNAGTINGNCGGSIACTTMTFASLPGDQAAGGLRSPIDGVVTSWKVKAGSSNNPVNLRILRPGAGFTFTGVGTSSTQMTNGSIAGPFPTQLPIKTGDAIGVDNPTGALINSANPGATQVYWTLPSLADGETRAGANGGGNELLVQAVVEPDVDCDNAGDETQDTNLTDGPCKSLPKQTLSAKKKQKVGKATIRETVDKDSTVVVQGTAKAKSVAATQSSTSVAANTPTAIKIAFAKKAKKKLKRAIKKKGPRQLTATATATDKFGNVSTDTVKFKLKG